MNRLGDCICAIPAKPPEEHREDCPVRVRAGLEELARQVRVSPALMTGMLAKTLEAFGIRHRLGDSRELMTDATFELVAEYLGAGADQAPGRAPDARQGAPRRAAAPELRLVEPSHPKSPLASPAGAEADGSCPPCPSCRVERPPGAVSCVVRAGILGAFRCVACGSVFRRRGAPEGGGR